MRIAADMADRPRMRKGKIIWVGGIKAAIALVRDPGHPLGDGKVVYVAGEQAIHRDVKWTGNAWAFRAGDRGGHADQDPALQPLIRKLQRDTRGQ
jgi:hypothetical protein